MNTIAQEYASSLMNRIIDVTPNRAGELVEKYSEVKAQDSAEAWDTFIEWLQQEIA